MDTDQKNGESGSAKGEKEMISRAQGCFMGHPVGDSLGSPVEFKSPESIRKAGRLTKIERCSTHRPKQF
jgi:ADP-ribosylglycohydrolase